MNKTVLFEKKYGWLPVLLMVGAVLVNIKSVFTDFDVDSEYAVAMAYRMVQGDRLIAQMWEPHQTSAFLSAFFMKIYIGLLGTTTGIVLYLHIIGVALKGIFTYVLYRTMKRYVNPRATFFMCLFFFSVFPKGIPMPEFSNMQLWFSVGLFCSLVRFFEEQEKRCYLLFAGVFLFLEVLAYPSCVLVYVGVVFLLFAYTKEKWKNTLLLTATCLLPGGSLCVWILSYTGLETFIQNLQAILTGDSSHSVSMGEKFLAYFQDFAKLLLFLAVFFIAARLLVILTAAIRTLLKKTPLQNRRGNVLFVYNLLLLVYVAVHAVMAKERYHYLVVYIPILVMSFVWYQKNTVQERKIICTGLTISLLSFLATLVLSNLTLTASMNYMTLAVCLFFIPAVRVMEEHFDSANMVLKYSLIWVFCALAIFRMGYIFKPFDEYIGTIFELRGIVKDGPALGVMSKYMGPYIMNTSMAEWELYVKDGDCILLVGENAVSTIGYLYKDTQVSVGSTICTPTYDEQLLTYWEQNPEKYPDVVIVDCWFGKVNVSEDSWIMQWINEEFRADEIVDGQYWRYYRKNTVDH